MIPTGGVINAPVQEAQQPSLTWYLDFEKGKVVGKIDGLVAIRQSVFMILQTERFNHLIYSFNYGHELQGLIGKSPLLVQSEINRIINEALGQDDRIQGIQNLSITSNGDSLTCAFTVVTDLGNFDFSQEVI